VIGGVAGVLPFFGVVLPGPTIAGLVNMAVVVSSAALAVYGRITADKKIG